MQGFVVLEINIQQEMVAAQSFLSRRKCLHLQGAHQGMRNSCTFIKLVCIFIFCFAISYFLFFRLFSAQFFYFLFSVFYLLLWTLFLTLFEAKIQPDPNFLPTRANPGLQAFLVEPAFAHEQGAEARSVVAKGQPRSFAKNNYNNNMINGK